MRLALLSDIHANWQGLEACLAHAQSQGAEQLAFLGDLVGYGGDPDAVVTRIAQLMEAGAWVIKGNHDAMAVTPPTTVKTIGETTAAWTHGQLSTAQRNWINDLPLTHHAGNILLVHASAHEPENWHYVYEERAAAASLDASGSWPGVHYVFGGHVHLQALYCRGASDALMRFTPKPGVAVPTPAHRQWLATVGSLGQPRDGNTQAMYALFDTDRAELTFYRVPYDHEAAAAAIRRAGLPPFFADRLERGQ